MSTTTETEASQIPLTLVAGGHSVTGKRASYEDRLLLAPELRLFAVADGLGGHQNGATAAQTCVDTLRSAIERAGEPSADTMREAVELAHRAVRRLDVCRVTRTPYHKMSCHCQPPGTTLSAVWFKPRSVIVAHTGDCRVYRWRSVTGGPEVLTREHRLGSSLSQYVGRPYGELEVDVREFAIGPGHVLLVASDGLWEPLEKLGARQAAIVEGDPAQRARNLVALVESSSDDNISALLVDVGSASEVDP